MSSAAKEKYEETLDKRYTEYIIDEDNSNAFLCLKNVKITSFLLAIEVSF